MPLDGSPKKFAQDVSSGLISVNRMMLKRFTPVEIQKMSTGLMGLLKELRTEVVDSGDFQAMKEKGMKQQRVNGALMTVRGYAKENKITVA